MKHGHTVKDYVSMLAPACESYVAGAQIWYYLGCDEVRNSMCCAMDEDHLDKNFVLECRLSERVWWWLVAAGHASEQTKRQKPNRRTTKTGEPESPHFRDDVNLVERYKKSCTGEKRTGSQGQESEL
jgi:hypothetical protein